MSKREHLKVLKQGVEAWNDWRILHQLDPDLNPF